MDNEIEKAKKRLENNDYIVGGLGMIRRNYDQSIVTGNYTSRFYKSSIIKMVYKKIKSWFKKPLS